jgi:hypothetical protein
MHCERIKPSGIAEPIGLPRIGVAHDAAGRVSTAKELALKAGVGQILVDRTTREGAQDPQSAATRYCKFERVAGAEGESELVLGHTAMVVRWKGETAAPEAPNGPSLVELAYRTRFLIEQRLERGDLVFSVDEDTHAPEVRAWFSDPRRAVRMALSILAQQTVGDAGGSPRLPAIGIASELPQPDRQQLWAGGLARDPGQVLVDKATYDKIGSRWPVQPKDDAVFEVLFAGEQTGDGGTPGQRDQRGTRFLSRESLQTVGAVIGAVASLAVWTELVGGITMWARLHAANVPALEGVAILPRSLLLTQGLRTLAVPLLLGGVAAGVAVGLILARFRVEVPWRRARAALWTALGEVRRWALIAVGVLILCLIGLTAWGLGVKWPYAFVIFVFTLVAAAGVFLAVIALRARPRWLGFAVFAIVAVWAGVAGFLQEYGSTRLHLKSAIVVRRDGLTRINGLYIAQTSDDAYIAAPINTTNLRRGLHCIVVVPDGDIRTVAIGVGRSIDDNATMCTALTGQTRLSAGVGGTSSTVTHKVVIRVVPPTLGSTRPPRIRPGRNDSPTAISRFPCLR